MDAALNRWEADALRIGSILKRHRVALGITQAALAEQSGIARVDYELLETGDWPLSSSVESSATVLTAVVGALERSLIRESR